MKGSLLKTLLALLLLIPSLSFSDDQKIYDKAYDLYLQNDYKGAIELFLKISDNIDAQFFLGYLYDQENDSKKSVVKTRPRSSIKYRSRYCQRTEIRLCL